MYTHKNFAEFDLGIGEGKVARTQTSSRSGREWLHRLRRAGHPLFDQREELRPGLVVLEDADHG